MALIRSHPSYRPADRYRRPLALTVTLVSLLSN
jgi:hypothetical protein